MTPSISLDYSVKFLLENSNGTKSHAVHIENRSKKIFFATYEHTQKDVSTPSLSKYIWNLKDEYI